MGALHLAYLALGLAPGDEVIVPAQTHVATAMAVEACGGRCTFVDVDAATITLPDTANENWLLHPVQQRRGADERVRKQARFDITTGQFSVPARSAVVFVLEDS